MTLPGAGLVEVQMGQGPDQLRQGPGHRSVAGKNNGVRSVDGSDRRAQFRGADTERYQEAPGHEMPSERALAVPGRTRRRKLSRSLRYETTCRREQRLPQLLQRRRAIRPFSGTSF